MLSEGHQGCVKNSWKAGCGSSTRPTPRPQSRLSLSMHASCLRFGAGHSLEVALKKKLKSVFYHALSSHAWA